MSSCVYEKIKFKGYTWRTRAGALSAMEGDEVARLRARIVELEQQLQRMGPKREKIETMSAEVVDSNPYR